MSTLSSHDLLSLSAATAKLYRPCSMEELPGRVIAVARELLDCEHLSYNEFGEDHFLSVLDPIIDPELEQAFSRLASQHPSIIHVQREKIENAVKISDFVSQEEWQRTELFNEFFRKIDIRYQLAFLFPVGEIQIGFAANRESRDFSEQERVILTSLLPHLRQAYENARVYDRTRRAMDQQGFGTSIIDGSGKMLLCTSRAREAICRFFGPIRNERVPGELWEWAQRALRADSVEVYAGGALQPLVKEREGFQLTVRLSPNHETGEHTLTTDELATSLPVSLFKKFGHSTREAEVLSWIAQGKTNPEIAIILDISAKTVAHHVERILSRIGVEGRGSAGAWAQEALRNERMAYRPSQSSR